MKVLLVNGSPKQFGCTYTALAEIEKTLNLEGVETEIFWIGNDAISGCKGCGACRNIGKCVINDIVNDFNDKASRADGFIFGSPVHFASASGSITSFLDRVFYSGKSNFLLKPASVIASARRAGTTATLDQLTKYLTISQMPVVSSKYWNMVHGTTPADVLRDEEGLQTMRVLAKNMAYLLKCIDAGKKAGVPMPEREDPISTNFIR
jgi:multimeric flavodoxin WrbA